MPEGTREIAAAALRMCSTLASVRSPSTSGRRSAEGERTADAPVVVVDGRTDAGHAEQAILVAERDAGSTRIFSSVATSSGFDVMLCGV